MSSLLFKEIHEVESIYRNTSKQLANIRGVSELKELVDAIEAKVNADINELEWFKRDVVKGLEIVSQKDKKLYKIFYTQALHTLYMAKNRAMLLSRLASIANLYVYLTSNDECRVSLVALKKVVDSSKKCLEDTSGLSLYVLVEYGYSMINILREFNIIVLCIPSYDLFKPWKWTLLFHELGHVLFDIKRDIFIREFRKRIMPLLKQLAPTGVREEHVNAILSAWERYWLKEFVADLYGVAIGGPAYTYAFMIEAFNSNPSEYIGTHPSLDSRMYLQLKYLENVAGTKKLVNDVRELWFSHRENVVAEGLGYPFTNSVLNELNRIFIDVTKKPIFLDYIDEVIKLQERIDKGDVVAAAPLYLILALTLSKRGKEDEVQRKVIETIVEDR